MFSSRLHLCRHIFASLWGDCLRFASHWRANARGDSSVLGVHFSNVFWGLLFVFVFVTRTYFKSFLKVYYRPVFMKSSKVVFWKCVRQLLVHASMKPGCLARRPLCHKVNLSSCVARRPLCHTKVNLPSCVVGRRPLCQKVNLPRCETRRRLCHKVNQPRCEARRLHQASWLVIFSAPDKRTF